MTHIAIIGAGITGVTTAYAVLERGYKVTVLDKHRYAAMETSFANGGQLSASHLDWTLSATTAQMIAGTIDGWRGLNAPSIVPSLQEELAVEREMRRAS